ncbi:hypothetical protein PB2503_09284 [Parvularcula bermudensis HTCC2503]|uniref:Uncharacterized protein n=1 Tax=Parvularcula bermudensis (strain ATCC BAA-594 / HTCC2503 / KCTC 12087) TaxID=314260 RepID=E0TD87_PARBH|nr:hypothetical protein [Parvularcula bermudensis]ADM09910.1 hypothetical protein PB2503_09284 [Parvularcula bermudensis HTCC2503]
MDGNRMFGGRALFLLAACGLWGCASSAPTLPPEAFGGRPEIAASESPDWENWGPDENRRRRLESAEGERLSTAALRAELRGGVLRGCYPSGTAFAERLALDGTFTDELAGGRVLGTYSLEDDMLCFDYEEADAGGCYAVFRREETLNFFNIQNGRKVATTACE